MTSPLTTRPAPDAPAARRVPVAAGLEPATCRFDVVVPTIGRPSLRTLLDALAAQLGAGAGLQDVVVVDDRSTATPAGLGIPRSLHGVVTVVRSGGRGPAAARNAGWRAGDAPWIVFLDDDVVPDRAWMHALAEDLAHAAPDVGGVQGTVHVPLPTDRRPTDIERDVSGLAHARWITADMAYRREVLLACGGFDEGFPRAYREDADLAARVAGAGWRLTRGSRRVSHPVRPAPWWISVRRQRGNADDARLRARHGRRWRAVTGSGRGRLPAHVLTTAAAATAILGALARRRRVASIGAAVWATSTARFALARISPGPRDLREVLAMAATSVAIPPVACWHRVLGEIRQRARRQPARREPAVRAVLFDRDGTLVADVPYNGDPGRVRLLPGVAEAVAHVRAAGVPIGVVSNQSGIARGLLTAAQVHAVNRRVEELIGPVDVWLHCPHDGTAGCGCRKPEPGMVLGAARQLGVAPEHCALIGDISTDLDAARRAGAHGILVPTPATRYDEVLAAARAGALAPTLTAAVRRVVPAAREALP